MPSLGKPPVENDGLGHFYVPFVCHGWLCQSGGFEMLWLHCIIVPLWLGTIGMIAGANNRLIDLSKVTMHLEKTEQRKMPLTIIQESILSACFCFFGGGS